ncbi:MAG TPA: ABC transporter permease subunit, partial [Solirubrobacteraceae bacterium]|nr:ABC transporter permease subunit [Solirubrobacteraceae bacterium]
REASFALGRTRVTTIRRVLHPAIRADMATGLTLGLGRIIGDTAIIAILLGSFLKFEAVGSTPVLSTLRGTGSTLTTYIYENSPAGEGSAPQKAYAAAFILLLLVLALNGVVTWFSGQGLGPRERGRAFTMLRFEWLPLWPWR